MPYDFVNTQNNPNLTNPGASFTDAFQGGMRAQLSKNELAQQKQLTMAQMGQQQQQFDVTSQLKAQQQDVERQTSMANIALMSAQQQNAVTQNQMLQFQAAQQPKVAANNATMAQLWSDPQASNPLTRDSFIASMPSKLPNPEAFNPNEFDQQVAARNVQFQQTRAGIAAANSLATDLKTVSDAQSQYGIDVHNYITGQNPDGTPKYNVPAISQQMNAVAMQRAQGMENMKTQGQIDVANAQMGGRLQVAQTLATARGSSAQQRQIGENYRKAYDAYQKFQQNAAPADVLQNAKKEMDKWGSLVDGSQASDSYTNPPDADPNGAAQNPAGQAWINTMPSATGK